MAGDRPLDAFDPRFGPTDGADEEARPTPRTDRVLVESAGPGPSRGDPKVRALRVAVPLLALAGLATVVAVFFSGLDPGDSQVVVGPADEVARAVADRPYRVCFNDANPCAWLTVVGEEVVAFNTNGPLAEEYGRQGVAWCPSSGHFGANATGSVWDQQGRIVEGPAPRSLDRFTTTVDARGDLVIDFASLNAGLADWQVAGDVSPPDGPPCDQIPFDRAPDLDLGAG
jgi:hypothetical protein